MKEFNVGDTVVFYRYTDDMRLHGIIQKKHNGMFRVSTLSDSKTLYTRHASHLEHWGPIEDIVKELKSV